MNWELLRVFEPGSVKLIWLKLKVFLMRLILFWYHARMASWVKKVQIPVSLPIEHMFCCSYYY